MTANLPYLLTLHRINGLGPIRLKLLLDYFKDPKIAWETDKAEWQSLHLPQSVIDAWQMYKKELDPQGYGESLLKSGIKILTVFDDNYPSLLKEIYDPPTVLYFKGEIPLGRAIAIVGTRSITGYGKVVTERFAKFLAETGITIISGLARGVDSLAHQSAISVDGKTVAVLGGGLNNIFPAENEGLASRISNNFGAVISEFPPDFASLPGNFPARNRIISGLSLAVLVTEAAEDSGSLITARDALEQGRDVFAVPGPITSDRSKGTAILIKQGARLVTDPEEILEELGIDQVQSARFARRAKLQVQNDLQLSEDEKKILEYLKNETKHLDEICRELKLSTPLVSSSLIKMEIRGLVQSLGGGNYVKAI